MRDIFYFIILCVLTQRKLRQSLFNSFTLKAMNGVSWWKLLCGPWTEVVSHVTPPYLVKVKINFAKAQKLTWKEIKSLYGLKTIITSNHISELLKMQLESKSRNVHKYGTRSGFISKHAHLRSSSVGIK